VALHAGKYPQALRGGNYRDAARAGNRLFEKISGADGRLDVGIFIDNRA
jgi:hypothetical protein